MKSILSSMSKLDNELDGVSWELDEGELDGSSISNMKCLCAKCICGKMTKFDIVLKRLKILELFDY